MRPELFQVDTALVTAHAVIRRFRENEGSAFYTLLENNRLRLEELHLHSFHDIGNPEACEYFVRSKLADWLMQRTYAFGVWHQVRAEAMGYVELSRLEWAVPRGELVFFIDRSYEGKGYMTEVVKEVLRFAFGQLRLERVSVHIASDNYAAQRLARKCGFSREGELRAYFRKPSGEKVDVVVMAAYP